MHTLFIISTYFCKLERNPWQIPLHSFTIKVVLHQRNYFAKIDRVEILIAIYGYLMKIYRDNRH